MGAFHGKKKVNKRKETKGWKITLKQNRGKMEMNLATEIWANPAMQILQFSSKVAQI